MTILCLHPYTLSPSHPLTLSSKLAVSVVNRLPVKLLPVALNVQDKRCLIVGGGSVAQRKAKSLVECGAQVTVISPDLCDGFASFMGNIQHLPRVFQSGDVQDYYVVFACTSNPAVNATVAREAQAQGIWCNVADDPAESDFHSAAAVRRGEVCIGITTAGGSPALARHLKTQVEQCIGPEYEQLLEIVSLRRAALQEKFDAQQERAEIWRAILASNVLQLLKNNRRMDAEILVDEIIESNR